MRYIFYFLFTYTVCLYVVTPLTCPPGTYFYKIKHSGEQFCVECQDGAFLPYSDHEQTACITCDKIKDQSLEILVSPCNKTHDAVIHCVDGYYRDEAKNPPRTGMCKKCTLCPEFTGRPCGTYNDTVCCGGENYDVVTDDHGKLQCKVRPWFCRRGQYFETRGYLCLSCPVNTFMPIDYHIQPECWKCREYDKYDSYRPLHSVIIQPCNSTHAPVIRCEDGFFMDPNMGNKDDALGCSPCTDCSTKTDVQYEGRKCDGLEDTVCCPQANMTVIDTPKGPVCCPEANMTVGDTPDGLVCKDPLKEHSDGKYDEGKYPHQTGERGVIDCDCAPCLDTSVPPGTADQNTAVDPDALETFSNNNQKSNEDYSLAYLFGGIVIGVVLSFVCPLIYKKFWPRQKAKQTPLPAEDPGETEPLNETSIDTLSEEIDDHSKEQCCGNESDLYLMRESCEFVEDHRERFIDANSFNYEHLPQVLREDGKMDYIKAVRDLTVRLKVNHTSENRPKNFPCHKLRGRAGAGIKRFGNGLVFRVIKKFAENSSSNHCPCRACSVYHDNARNNWAEFAVVTSAHVVYDDIECAQTSCRLWFDHDEDYIKLRSLNGRTVEERNETTPDVRIMHCITHDLKVSQKLEEKIAQWDNLREQYKRPSTTEVEEENRLAVLISHQHALSKKISVVETKVKMDGDIQKRGHDFLTCPGSSGAPICILGKSQPAGILTTIHCMGNESTGFYL